MHTSRLIVTVSVACHWYICKYVTDLYRAKISEEDQGTVWMGAKGQDTLTESSGSSNDV